VSASRICGQCKKAAVFDDQTFCEGCGSTLPEIETSSLNEEIAENQTEPQLNREPLLSTDLKKIDGYNIEARLGSGGFGVVYEATNSNGKKVALKVLRPELSDDQRLRSRLAREAEALRRVQSDRTAKIFEVVTESDRAYLVMELVDVKP